MGRCHGAQSDGVHWGQDVSFHFIGAGMERNYRRHLITRCRDWHVLGICLVWYQGSPCPCIIGDTNPAHAAAIVDRNAIRRPAFAYSRDRTAIKFQCWSGQCPRCSHSQTSSDDRPSEFMVDHGAGHIHPAGHRTPHPWYEQQAAISPTVRRK